MGGSAFRFTLGSDLFQGFIRIHEGATSGFHYGIIFMVNEVTAFSDSMRGLQLGSFVAIFFMPYE